MKRKKRTRTAAATPAPRSKAVLAEEAGGLASGERVAEEAVARSLEARFSKPAGSSPSR